MSDPFPYTDDELIEEAFKYAFGGERVPLYSNSLIVERINGIIVDGKDPFIYTSDSVRQEIRLIALSEEMGE